VVMLDLDIFATGGRRPSSTMVTSVLSVGSSRHW